MSSRLPVHVVPRSPRCSSKRVPEPKPQVQPSPPPLYNKLPDRPLRNVQPPAPERGPGAILGAADSLVAALQSATAALQRPRQREPPARSRSTEHLFPASQTRGQHRALSSTCGPGRRFQSTQAPLNVPPATPSASSGKIAQITETCANLTKQLRSRGTQVRSGDGDMRDDGPALCEVWASSFNTGMLQTSSCSKVSCYPGRIEYTIRHPEEDSVQMVIVPPLHGGRARSTAQDPAFLAKQARARILLQVLQFEPPGFIPIVDHVPFPR